MKSLNTAQRTRPQSRRRRVPIVGLAPLVGLLFLWQLLGTENSVNFPRPSEWWAGWTALLDRGLIGSSLLSTVTTFLLALAVSTVVGAGLGALVGSSRAVDRATSPLLQFLMSVPPAAIVPVAVLVIGLGTSMQITAIAFGAVWPILLNTASAMRSVPGVRLEAARLLGLSRTARFSRVVLPSLTPGVLLGVTVAAPIAIVVTLLVEMLTTSPGLGSLLLQAQRAFRSEEVFALLVVTGILGYVLNTLVSWLEAFLLRNWPEGARR
jgi:ABC-type nitrate/sulfonate/bicarbonate transport system permease component